MHRHPRRGAQVLLLGALALLLCTGAADGPDTSEPSACTIARDLVSARLLDAAAAAYKTSAAACADRAHELDVIAKAVRERDAALVAARKAKKGERRRDQFALVLAIDAGSAEARREYVEAGGTLDPDAFAKAQALLDAGFRDKARDEVETQVAAGEQISDASQSLRDLAGGRGPHLWDTLASYATGFIGFAIPVLIAVGIAAALLNWLFFEALRRRRKGFEVLSSDASSLKRRWRQFRTPYLAVANLTGDDSEMFATEVRTLIRRASRAGDGSSIQVATLPDAELGFSDLAEIDVRLKPLAAALKYVMRHDTVHATTTLKGDGKHLVRASVELSAVAAGARSQTFELTSSEEDPCTAALVGLVAGWTMVTASELRPRVQQYPVGVAGLEITKANQEIYGTASAESFGLFLGGVQAFLSGHAALSRRLFSQAIAADLEHVRAHLNLGLTEAYDSEALVRRSGIDRLTELLERGSSLGDHLSGRDRLLACHNLSAAHANEAFATEGAVSARHLTEAERGALRVLITIIGLRADHSPGQLASIGIDSDWLKLLRDAAAVNLAIVVERRAMQNLGDPRFEPAQVADGRDLRRVLHPTPAPRGNNAVPPALADDRDLLHWIVRRLLRQPMPATPDEGREPRPVTARSSRVLLESVHADRPPVVAEMAYNLACYFALHPSGYGRAIRYLTQAFALPNLKAWADLDPQLAEIRTSEDWKQLAPRAGSGVAVVTEDELASDDFVLERVPWPSYLRFVAAQSHHRWRDIGTDAALELERADGSRARLTVRLDATSANGVVGVELGHADDSWRQAFLRATDDSLEAEVVLPGEWDHWYEWQLFLLRRPA
jgi:hypothetical protein